MTTEAELEAARGTETFTLHQSLWRQAGLFNFLSSNFWPPDCERINCCFKPPPVWSLVATSLGNKYRGLSKFLLEI